MSEADELRLERVVHYPLPGMNAPANVKFAPDGQRLTYLRSEDGTLTRQLWAYAPSSGETTILVRAPGEGDTDATVSAEEALRRERTRTRGYGITNYAWARKSAVLLVPVRGRLFVKVEQDELRQLDEAGPVADPQLDPMGRSVAYVRDGELWVLRLDAGAKPRQLTFDAAPVSSSGERVITNGLAEFIAQEEMGRGSGFWWSDDGERIAYAQVNTSAVVPYTIAHQGEGAPSAEVHRYPFSGAANARVRLGIVDADGSETRWVPLPEDEEYYLARVDWTPDGGLLIQLQTRDQRRLDLLHYDSAAGRLEPILSERAETWVNLHDDLRVIRAEGAATEDYEILWSSERTGFRHLYLYGKNGGGKNGAVSRQLTHGRWAVDRVLQASDQWVYFLAGKETPLERHLYRVSLYGGEPERLTSEPGMHTAVLSPTGDRFVDLWDTCDRPPGAYLRTVDGSSIAVVYEGDSAEASRLGLAAPEFLTVAADDGTELQAALYRPAGAASEASPLVVSVYGGPHVQQVTNSWAMRVDLRAQYLARRGYAVLKLDNRGSARRGHAFEAAILGDLGRLEVLDQAAGVRRVSADARIDGSRVGIYGWSYGGYMAIMCLLRAPEVFDVAVAGAPVTDWSGYDTHYTERYMRRPQDNLAGYSSSSALEHAGALTGKLLILHGMIDENVHFRHSARLVEALIRSGKDFEILPFPNERHMPRDETSRLYMEQRLVDFFERWL